MVNRHFNVLVAGVNHPSLMDKYDSNRMVEKYVAFEYAKAEEYRKKFLEGLEEGRAEGRTEGLEEGRLKGLNEGRAEGRAEGAAEKALSDARSFLAEGIPPEIVAKCIGLPLEEVKALQKKV